MERNEIKKLLYKENPNAIFDKIVNGVAYYFTLINKQVLRFEVPINDMGTAEFKKDMSAKHLIRWLV